RKLRDGSGGLAEDAGDELQRELRHGAGGGAAWPGGHGGRLGAGGDRATGRRTWARLRPAACSASARRANRRARRTGRQRAVGGGRPLPRAAGMPRGDLAAALSRAASPAELLAGGGFRDESRPYAAHRAEIPRRTRVLHAVVGGNYVAAHRTGRRARRS